MHPPAPATTPSATLRIVATVPEGTDRVSIAGSIDAWGPWQPGVAWMEGDARERTATATVPVGTEVMFKLTRGSWATQAMDNAGYPRPNYTVKVEGDTVVYLEIAGFRQLPEEFVPTLGETGLVGRVELLPSVPSAHLELPRSVLVWLPEEYDANPEARFPVIYMHDGQNLFDPRVPGTQIDWGVDEVITRMVAAGEIDPVIVVGAFSTDNRKIEYRPVEKAAEYGRFLTSELKPMIDQKYRTLTDRANTMVMGSSRGGIISFYLAMQHPDVFGLAGCLSTYYGQDLEWVEALEAGPAIAPPARFYFDYGTAEPEEDNYPENQARMTALLKRWGWVEGKDFTVYVAEGADHSEGAWRERLHLPLKFLLGN